MIAIIFIALIILGIVYIALILKFQTLQTPTLKLKDLKRGQVKNILFIYPHPDDETMISGGLIGRLSKDSDFNVFVIDITKGEKGDEILKISPEELGKVREGEFNKAMKSLGVKNFSIWDFPDGGVPNKYAELKERITKFISENNIDLAITFERFGIYGHQDHVALSKIINEISIENKDLKVLYSTLSPKVAKELNLKDHIKGLELEEFESNEVPEFKVPIFSQLLNQYIAARNYKSQNLSHKYPLWVTIFIMPYEYYTSQYKKVN